jgi:hypothetical protein
LDLRALDAEADDSRADMVVRSVLEALPKRHAVPHLARALGRIRLAMAVAATVLAMLATGAVLAERRERDAMTVADLMERWTQSDHVPTNGELLTAYQGYRP